jgi:hypothetical protein
MAFYKIYSIILGKVIKEAKKLYYYKLIDKSVNKVWTTWKVKKKHKKFKELIIFYKYK